MRAFGVYNGIASIFFYTAVWIFALKYHETATEVSVMLGSSEITSLLDDESSEADVSNV